MIGKPGTPVGSVGLSQRDLRDRLRVIDAKRWHRVQLSESDQRVLAFTERRAWCHHRPCYHRRVQKDASEEGNE